MSVWAEIICLFLGAMMVSAILYSTVHSLYGSWKIKRRLRRGQQAEKNAIRFLRHRGYRILAAQLQETIVVYVNGHPEKVNVRADYLVRKGWKTYIVEVKSGQQGTIRLPNVRRQLLEYKLVYQPDGILLLDMEHRALQEIRFAYPNKKKNRIIVYGLLSLLLGIIFYSLALV